MVLQQYDLVFFSVRLIPLRLKVKVREFMREEKTWDLRRDVRLIDGAKD